MGNPVIYTVGYGKRELAELLEVLQQQQVNMVVDVRSAPYSSFKPEFSRENLSDALHACGIGYTYFGGSLGGRPADGECYIDGKVDYELLGRSEQFQQGMARLLELVPTVERACLLCSEGRPEECHRSKLLGMVLERRGVEVRHIDAAGELRSQQQVMNILTGGQTSLFEEHYTSRKKYQTKTG